jgi:DNA-binding NtrC family response regulator
MDETARTHTATETLMAALPRLVSACLRVVDGPGRGAVHAVGASPVVVGTSEEGHVVLADRRVSRRHCEISAGKRGFLVRDLGSRNGTWFEGSRVGEAAVPPGALIRVGRTHLWLGERERNAGIEPAERESFGALVGGSLLMRQVYTLLERFAALDTTVLLLGETGTGKELAARAIHQASPRARGPFEVFDCGAAHPALVRCALFGYLPGSFTDAGPGGPGVFERAAGGTVFLDEIGELPLEVQPALLRACEQRTVQRIGGDRPLAVDTRIVAATNRDLAEEVAAGRFREDLYYRLQVLSVTLPPLRRRREDISRLCRALLAGIGVPDPGPIAGRPLAILEQHEWPGNVRELRNVLERALATAGMGRVASGASGSAQFARLAFHLAPLAPGQAPADASFAELKRRAVEEFERRYLAELLAAHAGNVRQASRASGIERTQLRRLLRRHGLR